jgi:hypothetical protein
MEAENRERTDSSQKLASFQAVQLASLVDQLESQELKIGDYYYFLEKFRAKFPVG